MKKPLFSAKKVATQITPFLLLLSFSNFSSKTYGQSHFDGSSSFSEMEFAEVSNAIEKSEYHINWDEQIQQWQSPNRKNNIRAFYAPGEWEMIKRKADDRASWRLRMTTIGLFADGKLLETPDKEAEVVLNESQIDFIHPSFTEQYINSPQGVRQNFIIRRAPLNSKELKIQLAYWGMEASAKDEAGLIFTKEEDSLSYTDLVVFDANGKRLPARMELDAANQKISLIACIEGAQYPITIDPLVANGSFADVDDAMESNQVQAFFGYSVAGIGDVNGDGYSDIAVGANAYDNGNVDEGAVFIYHGSSTGINTTAAIRLEQNLSNASFGHSVAYAGDVNGDGYADLIVGAIKYTNGQTYEGAAFIYHGSASGISSAHNTFLEENQAIAEFGYAVAGIGDVNGDGYSDVIVGAPNFDGGQSNEGVAYIYHGSASGISTTAVTNIESNQVDARWGSSLSGVGDVNGDGYSDVAIASADYDNGQTDEGVVVIYHGSASGISGGATILEENQALSGFGTSVSGAGDVNGDGYADVIVGATDYDNGQSNEGVAFVYHGAPGGINSTANIILEENIAGADFGYSVSGAGDVNGDGFADVIVGAPTFSDGESVEGAIRVYLGSSSGINGTSVAFIQSNSATTQLGFSVSGAGDVNGDGISDLLFGAPLYTNGQSFEGTAALLYGCTSGVNSSANISKEGGLNSSFLGLSASGAGDVNGDGYSDWIVGQTGYTNGQNIEGAATIYYGPDASTSITIESNQAFAQYGRVASAGDVNGDGYADVVVGAPLYDNGQLNEGVAFVYHGSASGINTTAAATLEANVASASFGIVSRGVGDINGDGYGDLVIGAESLSNGQSGEGLVFVYYGSSTGVATTPDDTLEINSASARFGRSLSGGDINGDGYSDLVVGASFYDNGQANEGAVFVFHGSWNGLEKTPNTTMESNQAQSLFGESVSVCGDVNGDGYADVVVGSSTYTNGQSSEGAAFVYHGSSGGLSTTASFSTESNQALSRFGEFSNGAGDLNGDGYADIVIGATDFDNGQSNEGAAFVYYGSESGIVAASVDTFELNQANADFGHAVAGVGDFDGDGYGDLMIGAPFYTNGNSREGVCNLYFGNGGGGLKRNIQLFNESSVIPISQANFMADSFNVSLFAKSFIGRTKGKLVWETMANGVPFSSASPITNSTSFTDKQSAFTDLGTSGIRLSNNVPKMTGVDINQTKVRLRIQYDPVTSLNGETFSPWVYPQGYFGAQGLDAVPLPIELLNFNAKLNNGEVLLSWSTATEINNDYFIVERSSDGHRWEQVLSLPGAINSNETQNYRGIDPNPNPGHNYYRLTQVDFDGKSETFHEYIRIVQLEDIGLGINVYPNPTDGNKLYLELANAASNYYTVSLLNAEGREMLRRDINLDVELGFVNTELLKQQNLAKGVYFLFIRGEQETFSRKVVVR